MGQSHAIAGVWRRSGWVPARLARWWAGFAEAQEGRFILWLPVFMGAGVLAYFDRQAEPSAWIGAQAAAACLTAALASGRWPLLRAIALAAGFAALGFASAQYATARAPPIETDLPAHAVMLSGTVQAVETLPNGRRVTVSSPLLTADERPQARRQADRPPPEPDRRLVRSARFRLASGDPAAIATGDSIRVRAMLRQPAPPAYPGAWDTQRDAFFAGLGASGYALGPVDVVARAPPARLAAQVRWVREAIAARVMAVLPGTSGAVTVTLLTGDQRGIPEADHTAYRDSGLAHLLAVAGLHIGIVMGAVFAAARVLLALSEHASLFWPTKKIAAVAALAAGGAYMILTGAHVPIVRSFAMACLVTIALLAGRQALSIRGLGLAGIVLMTIAPNEVPGVSFQMSFSAVLALIAGYEALRPWLGRQRRRSRLLAHVVALALTSTLAGTASLPYGAFHFSHVQSYYILSNMAAVPLTAFWVMPAGLIALILMPFGLEALALVPMGWGVALITEIARLTASLPGATIAVPHIPPLGAGDSVSRHRLGRHLARLDPRPGPGGGAGGPRRATVRPAAGYPRIRRREPDRVPLGPGRDAVADRRRIGVYPGRLARPLVRGGGRSDGPDRSRVPVRPGFLRVPAAKRRDGGTVDARLVPSRDLRGHRRRGVGRARARPVRLAAALAGGPVHGLEKRPDGDLVAGGRGHRAHRPPGAGRPALGAAAPETESKAGVGPAHGAAGPAGQAARAGALPATVVRYIRRWYLVWSNRLAVCNTARLSHMTRSPFRQRCV